MAPSPVVCNASSLIALEQIGLLKLLEQLFNSLLIPPAVAHEVAPTVTLPPSGYATRFDASRWTANPCCFAGAGESETISLALEVTARLIVLDDRPARRLAQALRLPVIGTLGILLAAKRLNLLPAIRPSVDALIQHDFRIASAPYKQVLLDADENP